MFRGNSRFTVDGLSGGSVVKWSPLFEHRVTLNVGGEIGVMVVILSSFTVRLDAINQWM